MERKTRDLFLMEDRECRIKENNTFQNETKGDLHGLGYDGMLNPSNFLYGDSTKTLAKPDAVSATLSSGQKLKISGEAFGYGALEDDDDGMMGSVYSKDDMSQYDFAIGGVAAREKLKEKRAGSFGKLTGNSLELEGFEKANKSTCLFNALRKNYQPQELPCNWRPKRRGKIPGSAKSSRWDKSSETNKLQEFKEPVPRESKQQPTLNANLRAVILGEEVVCKSGVVKSKKDEPPEKLKETAPIELAFEKVLHPPAETKQPSIQNALSGFFASRFTHGSASLDDPAISAGLCTFKDLKSMPGLDSGQSRLSFQQPTEQTENKPTRITYEWHPHKLLCKRFGLQNPFPLLTDVVGIVSIDRGGQKTRNMTSAIQKVKSSNSRTMFAGLFGNLSDLSSFSPSVSGTVIKSNVSRLPAIETLQTNLSTLPTAANATMSQKQTQVEFEELEEENTVERPPIDLFKSIFASDEEDTEEEDEEKKNDTLRSGAAEKSNTTMNMPLTDVRQVNRDSDNWQDNSQTANSNSVGIFAGVDFSDLNQNFNPCLKAKSSEKAEEKLTNEIEIDDDCYGPALPPSLNSSSTTPSSDLKNNIPSNQHHKSSTLTVRVKDSEHERKRRHKDKKKRKEKHKKKKSKKKSSDVSKKSCSDRKRKHASSTDDSSIESSGEADNSIPGGREGIANIEKELLQLIKRARHGQ